jgi:hypothetical protein
MGMDTKDMMNEMGAAFAVTWLVMGMSVVGDSGVELVGIGMSGIMAVAALGVAWMAFAGAHILPPITWMHIMTGDLTDQDAWMANGMKLLMQVVGGALALIMMAKMGTYDNYVTYDMGVAAGEVTTEYDMDIFTLAGGVAAGAILWCIHTKSGSPWGTAVGVVAMGAFIGAETSTDMASELMNDAENIQAMLMTWILTGVSVGAGAMLAMNIDENL